MKNFIKYFFILLFTSYVISTFYLFNYTDTSFFDNSLLDNFTDSLTFYIWAIILLIFGGQPF